jgi:hypothetical protein
MPPPLRATDTDSIKALGAGKSNQQNALESECDTGFNLTGVPAFDQETVGFHDASFQVGLPEASNSVAG